MAITVGELIVELDLDSSGLSQGLEDVYERGLQFTDDFESVLQGIGQHSAFDGLHLSPTVDLSQIHGLNKEFDRKIEHAGEVQRSFDRNPLTPKVDMREVEKLEKAFKYAGTSSTLKLEMVEPPGRNLNDGLSQISNSLDAQTAQLISHFEKVTGSVTKVEVAINNQGKQSLLGKLFSVPTRIFDDLTTGLIEGLGNAFSNQISQGAADYVEGKTGASLYGLGRSSARFTLNRGRGFGEIGAQALGYRGGLKEVGDDIEFIRMKLDSLFDPRKFVKNIQGLEDLLVATLEDLTVFNDRESAATRVREAFAPDLQGVAEGASRVAGVGIRAAAQPFRIRKRVELARSAQMAQELSEIIKIPELENPEQVQAINLQTGGVDFTEGGLNTFFARNVLKNVLGPGVATVPVPNEFSNSGDLGRIFESKNALRNILQRFFDPDSIDENDIEPIPLDRLINLALEKGFNPDSILLEATRLAFEAKYPDKNFIFSGTSGGTVAAEEAVAIAERGGATNVKGFGATLGLYGLTNTASEENFRALVGDLDPIFYGTTGGRLTDTESLSRPKRKIFEASLDQFPIPAESLPFIGGMFAPTRNTTVVPGTGVAHHLGQFMADEAVQRELMDFLGPDFMQGVPAEFSGKQGNKAFKAYADIFAQFEALDRTFRVLLDDASALDELSRGQYAFVTPQNQLRRTFGEDQEFPDLRYATDEVQISKQVKGVAREEIESIQGVMQGLVDVVSESEDRAAEVNQDRVRELYTEFRNIFGATPTTETEVAFDLNEVISTLPPDIKLADLSIPAPTTEPSSDGGSAKNRRIDRKLREQEMLAEAFSATFASKMADMLDASVIGAQIKDVAPEIGAAIATSFLENVDSGTLSQVLDMPPDQPGPGDVASDVEKGAIERVGEVALNVGRAAGEAVGETASSIIVSRVNNLLKQVPGDPSAIEANPIQIGSLSELSESPNALARLAQLGASQMTEGLLGAGRAVGKAARVAAPIVSGGISGIAGQLRIGSSSEAVEDARLEGLQEGLNRLKEATGQAEMRLSARPNQSQAYLDVVETAIPRLIGSIDEALQSLDPVQRTGSRQGNQLANLKSQTMSVQARYFELVEQIEELRSSDSSGELTDALNLLKGSQERGQIAASDVPLKSLAEYRKLIESVGKEFFQQMKSAQALMQSGDIESAQAIARELLENEQVFRDALSLMKGQLSTETGAPPSVTKATSVARGRVTRGVKGAESIIQETEAAGVNVGSAYNEGLQRTISDAQSAADDLGAASLEALKRVLGIQSPSKMGIWIGEMLGKGFEVGLSRSVDDLTTLVNSGILPMFASIGNMTQESALDQSVEKAIARAKELQEELSAASAENNAIVIGGFAGMGGQSSGPVSEEISKMLGDSFSVDAVENIASDTTVGFKDKLKFVSEIVVKALTMEIVKGFNPDAIEAAAVAIARKNIDNVDSDFIGYSAGGFVARQAQQISERAGVDSRAVGIGTPTFGMFNTDPDRFRAFMGETDLLAGFTSRFGGRNSPIQRFLNAGDGHLLENYLSSGLLQNEMGGFLGKDLPGVGVGMPEMFAREGLQPFKKDAENVGESISEGLMKGMESGESESVSAAHRLASLLISTTKDVLGIQSPSKRFFEIGHDTVKGLLNALSSGSRFVVESMRDLVNEGLTAAEDEANGQSGFLGFQPFEVSDRRDLNIPIPIIGPAIEEGTSYLLDMFDTMKNMATFAPRLGRLLTSMTEGLIKNARLLAKLGLGFTVFQAVVPFLSDFSQQSIEAAINIQRVESSLQFITGSAKEASDQIREIREEADLLGADAAQSLEGFTQLAGATRGTSISGAATEQLADAIEQTAVVSSLTQEQIDRATVGFSQIAGKGVLSTEELQGQIAEVGGAFSNIRGITARALGFSPEELSEALRRGEVLAEDALPKIAQQLSAETASGVAGASKLAQASVNRFNNSLTELRESAGKELLPARQLGLEVAADAMGLLVDVAPIAIQLLGAIATKLGIDITLSALKASGALGVVNTQLGLILSGNFTNILGGLKAGTAAVGSFGKSLAAAAAPYAAIFGAIETINITRRSFSDLSGDVGDFADTAQEKLEVYRMAVEKAREATEGLTESVRINADQDSLFTGSLIESVIGRGASRGLEGALNQVVAASGVGVVSRAFGRDGIRSFAERQANQQTIARGELFQTINETLSESFGPDVQNAIAEVNEIDQQRSELQARRRNTRDSDERQALGNEIDELFRQREDPASVVGTLQGALATQQQTLQQQVERLRTQAVQGGANEEDYQRILQDLELAESQLEAVTAQQNMLTNSIDTTTSAAALLSREFAKVAAIAEDLRLDADIDDANRRLDVALQGGTVGGSAMAQLQTEADISSISEQIRINRQEMMQLGNLLEDESVANAFEKIKIDPSIGASDLLQELDSGARKQSDETDILRDFAENTIRMKQLEAETINFDADLADARTDLQDQARQLAVSFRDMQEQISDFYRDAMRGAEDLANQIATQDIQNETQNIATEIRRELLGLEDSFVSGLGDTFTGLIESLRQPLLNELEAMQQRNDIERTFQDQMRSARDLQRQAEELDFDAGLGPDPRAGLPMPQMLSQTVMGADGQTAPRVITLSPQQAFTGGFLGEPALNPENLNPMPLMSIPEGQATGDGFGNAQIMAASELAARTAAEQLAGIDRNLATQTNTAAVEAESAIAAITRQLEEGRRSIAEQSDNFGRSLRDIGQEIGNQNPLRELESSLLSVNDQFTDTNRELQDFQQGLLDTIAETQTVRSQLIANVQAGTISEDALAILPDLDRTIAESQAALTRADGQIEENRELLEAQRAEIIKDFQDAEEERRRAAQERIITGRDELLSLSTGFDTSPFDLQRQRAEEIKKLLADARGEANQIAFGFDRELRELQDLVEVGELTKLEFSELEQNLIDLSNVKLDGLKQQFDSLTPTVTDLGSALGQTKGAIDSGAFTRIQENITTSISSEAFTQEQGEEAQEGLREARRISGFSDEAIIRELISTDNAFTSQFIQQAGRGDLVNLAEIGIQNRQAAEAERQLANIETNPEALAANLARPELAQPNIDLGGLGEQFAQGSDRLVKALDRLSEAVESGGERRGGVVIQQQNVSVPRDEEGQVAAATKVFNQFLDEPI